MKVGDYVGWRDIDGDVPRCPSPAGIILEKKQKRRGGGPRFAEYLILLQHNGQLSWEYGSDLVVMHESR